MPPDTPIVPIPNFIELPAGLLAGIDWMAQVDETTKLTLSVPEDYVTRKLAVDITPEVIGIQRLITLARARVRFDVRWAEKAWSTVSKSASIFPMLGVLLLLSRATHYVERAKGEGECIDVKDALKGLLKHRFTRDPFADSELVVCGDASGMPLPWDLYLPSTQTLRPRDDFETLVVDAVTAQVAEGASRDSIYRYASALGVVVAELVENTDMHGRMHLAGKTLGADAFRGVLFKRIKVDVPLPRAQKGAPSSKIVDCFEVSVFDSGIGYFESYTRGQAGTAVDL